MGKVGRPRKYEVKEKRDRLAKEKWSKEERIERLERGGAKVKMKQLIGENDTSIEDNRYLLRHGMELRKQLNYQISYEDPVLFEKICNEFLDYCEQAKIAPTRSGLCLWLGIDANTFKRWISDSFYSVHSMLSILNEYFHRFAEQKAMDGSLSPLIYFFQAKNYWGLQDKTEITHRSEGSQVIDISEQQRILRSTPGVVIDADFTPKTENLGAENLGTENLGDHSENLELENLGAENLATLLIGPGSENLGAENLEPENLDSPKKLKTYTPENLEAYTPADTVSDTDTHKKAADDQSTSGGTIWDDVL